MVVFLEPRLGGVCSTGLLTLADEAVDRIARHPIEPRPFAEWFSAKPSLGSSSPSQPLRPDPVRASAFWPSKTLLSHVVGGLSPPDYRVIEVITVACDINIFCGVPSNNPQHVASRTRLRCRRAPIFDPSVSRMKPKRLSRPRKSRVWPSGKLERRGCHICQPPNWRSELAPIPRPAG